MTLIIFSVFIIFQKIFSVMCAINCTTLLFLWLLINRFMMDEMCFN